MRYPNLRYGNPTEFAYYVALHYGGVKGIAKLLRRSERSVSDWLNQKKKIPWWVPEILRLIQMENDQIRRQMLHRTDHKRRGQLAVVTHEGQMQMRRDVQKRKPQITDLRLDDFDQVKPVVKVTSA